jgi:hypothetical protein
MKTFRKKIEFFCNGNVCDVTINDTVVSFNAYDTTVSMWRFLTRDAFTSRSTEEVDNLILSECAERLLVSGVPFEVRLGQELKNTL